MLERLATDRGAILHDPARVADAGDWIFDPAHWRASGTLTERPGGRGSILYLRGDGADWVLRRYRRGGLAARVARDRYLWTGEARTRAFRELRLLAALRARGLPVPEPVAARYRRCGPAYRAEIVTVRLPDARPLAELVGAGEMDDARWAAIGSCLRRFHAAGVQHADLNAHNILLGRAGEVWVLDFDRGRLRSPGAWSGRAIDRLARSLAKVGGVTGDWNRGFALLRLAHDA